MERNRPTERRSNEPSLEEFEGMLLIDEHALEDELKRHPDVFYRVSQSLVMAVSLRDEAKQHFEETQAVVDDELRRDAEAAQEKITEGAVKSRVATDERVKKAADDFAKKKTAAAKWQVLQEAFDKKGYALSKLVDLYLGNYYSDQASNKSGPVHAVERDRKVDIARQARSEHHRR
jgi:hypothetical protein